MSSEPESIKNVIVPRHVICVLGNWQTLDHVDAVVRNQGMPGFMLDRTYSQISPDERMTDSFKVCYDRVSPSMKDEDWQAVKDHKAVAYVLSPPVQKEQASEISAGALLLTAALLKNGGVAAKGESSGIAHGRDHWLELADKVIASRKQRDQHSADAILLWTWVRKPILDQEQALLYTCGMHLLGAPDVEVESSLEISSALEWMDLLGLYLAADRPSRPLQDGEGFRLRADGARRIMRMRPCARYEEDSFKFNPYGYIRLERSLQ